MESEDYSKKYGFLHRSKKNVFVLSSMCLERCSLGMLAYKPFLSFRTLKLLRLTEEKRDRRHQSLWSNLYVSIGVIYMDPINPQVNFSLTSSSEGGPKSFGEFSRFKVFSGNSLAVQWLGLSTFTAGAQVRSLVRELSSCKTHVVVKNKKVFSSLLSLYFDVYNL